MNSNGIVLLAALVAMGLLIVANKPTQADDLEMENQMIDIANIRKGVANGGTQQSSHESIINRLSVYPEKQQTDSKWSIPFGSARMILTRYKMRVI